MNRRLARRGVIAAGVAVAAAGGTVASANVATVTASTADTVVSSTSSRALSVNGGVMTDVLEVTLPAGHWVVTGGGDLVDWGPSDYTRCRIVVGATQIASVSTMVGDGSAAGGHGPASYLSPFSLTGGITLTAPTTANLQCWHDATVSSTGYVDPGATLWAHRTSSSKVAAG
jgi:hypothetical protein